MIAPSLCDICKNTDGFSGNKCRAFPEGNIPDEFCYLNSHFEKHHSQKNNILFELSVEQIENSPFTSEMRFLLHSIDDYNKEHYGGEPYVSYDKEKKEVVYNTQIKKMKGN